MGKHKPKPEALLTRRAVRADELISTIHDVNPTGLSLSPSDASARYALKSKLQSRLVLDFFDDLSFEPTEYEGVIGLRYRPGDRDACHAVLADLEPEARSRVQLRLDTDETTSQLARAAPVSATRVRRSGALEDGRRAQAEYDFEAARECFEAAMLDRPRDAAGAEALLELLVDQLAAWSDAVDVESRLTAAQRTPSVRALLAVAASELGDVAACHRLSKDTEHPRFAAAFTTLARQAVRRSNFDEATALLATARQFDSASPEIVVCEAELAGHRAAEREPEEQALATLLKTDPRAAEAKAREIVRRWPDSAPARRVVREADQRERSAQIEVHLERARAARAIDDDEAAVEAWREAITLGADVGEFIAAATERLEARRARSLVERTIEGVRAQLSGATLTAYLSLAPALRHEVRQRAAVAALDWLEELDCSVQRDWPANIAAVLALSSKRAESIAQHAGVLARIAHGRSALAELEASERLAARERDLAQLELARTALRAGEWRQVLDLAAGAHQADHRDAWKLVVDDAQAQLDAAARTAEFDAHVQAGRTLAALTTAHLAEYDPHADAKSWAARRGSISRAVRTLFAVQTSDEPEALLAADIIASRPRLHVNHVLDPSGTWAYWVSAFANEVFVRKIDVATHRVVTMTAYRTPKDFSFPDAQLDGEALWLISNDDVLKLSTRTWDVSLWHEGRSISSGEVIDLHAVAPGGRFEWLVLRDDTTRVFDLHRGRVHRDLRFGGFDLDVTLTEDGHRMWLPALDEKGRLLELGGSTETTLHEHVRCVVVAPGGKGLLGVDARPERPLSVSSLPAGVQIESLDDTDDDCDVAFATSREARVSYLLYGDVGRLNWLRAYGEEGGAVRKLWQVRCPTSSTLVQDLEGRHALLLTSGQSHLACHRLGRAPPEVGALVEFDRMVRVGKYSLVCGVDSPATKDATEAIEAGDWKAALRWLEPLRKVTGPARPHIDHLCGVALFHLERFDEAQTAFEDACLAEEGSCRVDEWLDWIPAVRGIGPRGSAHDLIDLVRAAKGALADGRGREALELLDVPLVWASYDVQLGAMLAVAAHDAGPSDRCGPMRSRLIAAAFLERFDEGDSSRLPLLRDGMSREQLEHVAARVRATLGDRA